MLPPVIYKKCCLHCLKKETSKTKHMTGLIFDGKPLLKLIKMNLINIRIYSTQLMLYLKTSCHSLTTHINGLHLGSDHLGSILALTLLKQYLKFYAIMQ